ncbi:unnamed protein product [Ilex paraguariensis]|uniref:NLP1-9 GAF domain-containing protein n=1 Tax=Ilex paraguariensis TaxID=185542 RepID=A0ABC8UVX2_9AQUA
MEYPFSVKEKGIGYWASPRAQAASMVSMDGVTRYPVSEDLFNNAGELMNFDTYAGWCSSPLATDQMLASYLLSPLHSMSMSYPPMDALSFKDQRTAGLPVTNGAIALDSFNCGDNRVFQQKDAQFGFPLDSADGDDSIAKRGNSCQKKNISDMGSCMIPRSLGHPLAEKMLRALSLFKESSGEGILAQFWVPIKHGDQYILSTYEQPYLLDQMLLGYREVSRAFTFSAELKPGFFPGLPGRVFTSRVPEWTSNVMYYNKGEYLRVQHAVDHEVRGSIAVPVFESDSLEKSCCAVLELVTMKEKPNFDSEMGGVCHALQAVNLRSIAPPRLYPQFLSKNQRAALAEITDVLRAVCHAHRLPLALIWVPCSYTEGVKDEIIRVRVGGCNTTSDEKCVLCIEDMACYVNDRGMQGFVHACTEHYLEEGQGIAGKALQSNRPFFFPDVKEYDISEYPLVHHARKFGLNAGVAIRLRSTYTGDDDYILEFFLPVNMKGGAEQQLLLNNLSDTMQRICKSLRTVLDAELVGAKGSTISNSSPVALLRSNSQQELLDGNLNSVDQGPLTASDSISFGAEADGLCEQVVF